MGKITIQALQWLENCYLDPAPSKTMICQWYADFKHSYTTVIGQWYADFKHGCTETMMWNAHVASGHIVSDSHALMPFSSSMKWEQHINEFFFDTQINFLTKFIVSYFFCLNFKLLLVIQNPAFSKFVPKFHKFY